jgi:paraquat-inducible protein A
MLICEHCDTVYRRRALAHGEVGAAHAAMPTLERHHSLM